MHAIIQDANTVLSYMGFFCFKTINIKHFFK